MTHLFILEVMSRVPISIYQSFLEREPLIRGQAEKQEDVREAVQEIMMCLEENL